MNKIHRYTLLPVILGANWRARLLADRLLLRYRVRSYVMSERRHPALLLAPSLRYRRLSGSDSYTDFVLHELTRFAEEHPDKLTVLIGMTSYYRTLMREHAATLERYYIFSEPELSFLETACATDPEGLARGEGI